jgi:hypothetical protein
MEALQDTGTQAQLWMWAGIGIGLLLGGAAGGIAAWLGDARALTLGLAVFLLCMGLPAATGALQLAQVAVQVQEQTVPARGRLLGYEAESASEAQRRKRPGGRPAQRPRVAFTTPEGQRLEFLGLGGSRSGLEVGAEVPVRYVAARPQEALVGAGGVRHVRVERRGRVPARHGRGRARGGREAGCADSAADEVRAPGGAGARADGREA